MGQKTNPNIFRLGVNKKWKTEFFEKKNQELSAYTFKDLEIKEYIERFIETQGLIMHDYKLHYSNSVINIYLSYFITPNFMFNKKVSSGQINVIKKTGKQSILVNSTKQRSVKRIINLKKSSGETSSKRTYLFKNLNSYKIKNYLKLKNYHSILNKPSPTIDFKTPQDSFLNHYQKLSFHQNFKSVELDNSLKKLLYGLSLFTKKQYHIVSTFHCLNKNFNLTQKQTQSFKEKFMLLQKFRNAAFFKEGVDLMFASISNKKTANLLGKFIALQFKTIKRHKFFLSFLKRTLTLFINANFSKVKGIKIIVKGRLNGAPRAKHKIITIGSVPVQTISSLIDYAQATTHNSNGSYGIKVWVVEND
jgi:ribosomal protein S3